ncbi:hypothetical protein F3Y22_tig00117048pilonHSYRG01383 [Hibiscus syriacus]|uniref:CCHC-type domain-containing protein n=1 Tax=Hibiscus syriacus TaxID=106335 RepID=A0A6A2WA14_HIBSY|nr:hypothetical protein F3Y22_tig00117048pilonHSYRG01383 [Hibiscus syriacus]
MDTAKMRSVERDNDEMGSVERDNDEMGSVERDNAESGGVEMDSAESAGVEMDNTEMGSVERDNAEMGSVERDNAESVGVEMDNAEMGSVERDNEKDKSSNEGVRGTEDKSDFEEVVVKDENNGSDESDSDFQETDGENSFDDEKSLPMELNTDRDSNSNARHTFPEFNKDIDIENPKFQKGMLFCSEEALKEAIRQYGRVNRINVLFKVNDNKRLQAVCRDVVHGNYGLPPCIHMILIRALSRLRLTSPNTLVLNVMTDYGTICSLTKCGRAREHALEMIQAYKEEFKAGCRRIISLDGCFLKGYYDGYLLEEVGIDANGGIYPIAYTVVESENQYSWLWFLEILGRDLDIDNSYGWCWATHAGRLKYQVECGTGNQHVVNMGSHSCSCRKWDLTGIPCVKQWTPVIEMEPILPLELRKPIGRPTKKRRKEVDEGNKNGPKLSKKGSMGNCSKCGKSGHNKRTCRGEVGDNRNLNQHEYRSSQPHELDQPSQHSTPMQRQARAIQPTRQQVLRPKLPTMRPLNPPTIVRWMMPPSATDHAMPGSQESCVSNPHNQDLHTTSKEGNG